MGSVTASPSCGLRWVKPVTFTIRCAVSPSGVMERNSSSFGGCSRRGIVSEGGSIAGFGAGSTFGFLMGGSGSCADGEGS